MSIYSSKSLASSSRIKVVTRQPQGFCLVPRASQFIALLVQFIVLMTHGDITTIPVKSPEDPDFILFQLVHGDTHAPVYTPVELTPIYHIQISALKMCKHLI